MKSIHIINLVILSSALSFLPCYATESNSADTTTKSEHAKDSVHPMDDAAITTKVKSEYVRQKLFDAKDISVMSVKVVTTNGVVSLTGTVKTQAEADNAVKYAKAVNGVKKVKSKIVVEPVVKSKDSAKQ